VAPRSRYMLRGSGTRCHTTPSHTLETFVDSSRHTCCTIGIIFREVNWILSLPICKTLHGVGLTPTILSIKSNPTIEFFGCLKVWAISKSYSTFRRLLVSSRNRDAFSKPFRTLEKVYTAASKTLFTLLVVGHPWLTITCSANQIKSRRKATVAFYRGQIALSTQLSIRVVFSAGGW